MAPVNMSQTKPYHAITRLTESNTTTRPRARNPSIMVPKKSVGRMANAIDA